MRKMSPTLAFSGYAGINALIFADWRGAGRLAAEWETVSK